MSPNDTPAQAEREARYIAAVYTQPRRWKKVCGQHQAPTALSQRKNLYPLYRGSEWASRAVWTARRISSPRGFDSWTTQPVKNRCTGWDILATLNILTVSVSKISLTPNFTPHFLKFKYGTVACRTRFVVTKEGSPYEVRVRVFPPSFTPPEEHIYRFFCCRLFIANPWTAIFHCSFLRLSTAAMACVFHEDAKTLKEGSAYMRTPGVHAPCATNTIRNPL